MIKSSQMALDLNNDGTSSMDVLLRALDLVHDDPTLPALEAISGVSEGLPPAVRKDAVDRVRDAALRPEMGGKEAFQEAILKRAIQSLGLKRAQQSHKQRTSSAGPKLPVSGVQRKDAMEQSNMKAPTAPKSKKYNVGDTFNTVDLMGLQVTDAGRKATCMYQFSRKTGRDGTMDLPKGTEVRYIGARAVYENQSSSKRMIFKVAAGTRAILNGQDVLLDADIEVAGVVNHIDENDGYNIQSRENQAKREEKARIKAAAAAAKAKVA